MYYSVDTHTLMKNRAFFCHQEFERYNCCSSTIYGRPGGRLVLVDISLLL